MKTLGHNIRTLRRQNNWNQGDVAQRPGISIPAFSKIETGMTDINVSRLEQIAFIFGMSAVKLVSLHESSQEPSATDLEVFNKKLLGRESEIIDLQKKVIELFEELRKSKGSV